MAYITISKKHFFHNLDEILKKTLSKDKIALVLKDNAYGHGIHTISKLAKEYGITRCIVQSNDEASEVQEYFEYILVLADIPLTPIKHARYTINDKNSISSFSKGTKVELKVNTGMNRNGIEMDELEESLELIDKYGLVLDGVFTHHGCADELNNFFDMQKDNFSKVKKVLKEKGIGVRVHSCNSAALFREKNFDEDMARVGIAAYGCLEMPEELIKLSLKPVLSVYATKISSRVVKPDCCVGYGATFYSEDKAVVSNYDFGYGAGFLRVLSNNYLTPNGVSLVGRISMDNSSFLSSDDKLLVFENAIEVAKGAGTISYEVLTSLKPHLKRVVV